MDQIVEGCETMKKKILQACAPIGMLIYAIYNIIEHLTEIEISNAVGIPVMITSIAFILVGLVYTGWCCGDKRNKGRGLK